MSEDCRYSPDIMAGGSDCRLCGHPFEAHAARMARTKDKAAPRSGLSYRMEAALRNIAAGKTSSHGLIGAPALATHEATIQALQRRRLIEGRNHLTDAGRKAIAKIEGKA